MSCQSDIAKAQNPEGELLLARVLNRELGWGKRGWRSVDCQKLPPSYYLDFCILRDKRYVEAWLEVKERFLPPSDQHWDWLFPLMKWIRGLELAKASGKPFYICFSYPDKNGQTRVIYMEATEEMKPEVVWTGRKDRGYKDDFFPHIELPHAWFKDITPQEWLND